MRDIRRDHPDFNASPFGGPDHHAAEIAVGLGGTAQPTIVGDGFGVVSQWHDAERLPITPHPPHASPAKADLGNPNPSHKFTDDANPCGGCEALWDHEALWGPRAALRTIKLTCLN